MKSASLLILIFLATASPAQAGVSVVDGVTPVGGAVMLEALTRGKFLPEGGRLVHFGVGGKPVGSAVLSGGDGRAYREFTPTSAGLLKVTASSDGDEAEGLLLVVGRAEEVVVVEAPAALWADQFGITPKAGAAEAIKNIAAKFPVIYLQTGLPGYRATRVWIKEKDFPRHPVIGPNATSILRQLQRMGITVRAVIGSPETLRVAGKYPRMLIGFEPAEGARKVSGWAEAEGAVFEGPVPKK